MVERLTAVLQQVVVKARVGNREKQFSESIYDELQVSLVGCLPGVFMLLFCMHPNIAPCVRPLAMAMVPM